MKDDSMTSRCYLSMPLHLTSADVVCAALQLAGYKVKCMLAEPKGKRGRADSGGGSLDNGPSWVRPCLGSQQPLSSMPACLGRACMPTCTACSGTAVYTSWLWIAASCGMNN